MSFGVLSAILLFAPLRTGDLAGYDDALYAHIAKNIVNTGDWLRLQSNGYPALEHPPMFMWMQAALFSAFGLSDALARLPAAICGFATILLVYWLGRRLTGNPWVGVLSMLVIATSLYFLKYAARAMTDVPFTFFFTAAICAWVKAEDGPRWYIVAGLLTGAAQLTRALVGGALPLIFVLDVVLNRRRVPYRLAMPSLVLALAFPLAWYAWLFHVYGSLFLAAHSKFLLKSAGGSSPRVWRIFTGPFEYAWMLAKSYWPWLPLMVAGLFLARGRARLVILWAAVVFGTASAGQGRVLRYLLPAYPAFAILAAIALLRLLPDRCLHVGLRIAAPVFAIAVLAVAARPRNQAQAAEIRPIARAASLQPAAEDPIGFYDAGQPRFDEINQLQWYGGRRWKIVLDRGKLLEAPPTIWLLDKQTWRTEVGSLPGSRVIAESGHLVLLSRSQ